MRKILLHGLTVGGWVRHRKHSYLNCLIRNTRDVSFTLLVTIITYRILGGIKYGQLLKAGVLSVMRQSFN